MNERVMDISNFYVTCLWSVVFFLLMMPAGYLSFRFIEAPILKQKNATSLYHVVVRRHSVKLPNWSSSGRVKRAAEL